MIKGPKDAFPSPRGWVSAKGELLKAQKISAKQIDEWHAAQYAQHEAELFEEPVVQTLHEAPVEEAVVSEELLTHHYGEEDEEE
jgi:hypothetical protein